MTDQTFNGPVSQVAGNNIINESAGADRAELERRRSIEVRQLQAVENAMRSGWHWPMTLLPFVLAGVWNWMGFQLGGTGAALVLFGTLFAVAWAKQTERHLTTLKLHHQSRISYLDYRILGAR